MKSQQLFTTAKPGFKLPAIIQANGSVYMSDAEGIPFMRWPDGRWCYPANTFMLSLFRRGLARTPRGGTLAIYAWHLSHFIRYCFYKPVDFHKITDQDFSEFMRQLTTDLSEDHQNSRTRVAATTLSIGHSCLNFLQHVGDLFDVPNLVGPTGSITASIKLSTAKGFKSSSWHHHSFPIKSPQRRRFPISKAQIQTLEKSAAQSSASLYQQLRRFIMLRLLEITGGRRSEVAALTVESVLKAQSMSKPALALVTRKRGDDLARLVPISSHDLRLLVDFATRTRKSIVEKTCGRKMDDGKLLVNERTGKGIQSNTVTQEIFEIARAAKMQDQICPHMFRHRFITKRFIALIEQHNLKNTDNFRQRLMDVNGFKEEVLEWTGHKRIESLDRYIHLAFKELRHSEANVESVTRMLNAEAAESELKRLEADLDSGIPPDEAVRRLRNIVADIKKDAGKFN